MNTESLIAQLKQKSEDLVKRGGDIKEETSRLVSEAAGQCHAAAGGLAAMVKAVREFRADIGIALHDHDFIGTEDFAQHFLQQGRQARREFRRFQHHAVTGGNRVDQRNHGQLEWVIPGRHDADHTEWQESQFATGWLESHADRA